MTARIWKLNASAVALAVVVVAAGGLAGCGGSSDGPAVATALTINGTATRAAAIGGKTVEAKCKSGTGSRLSEVNGSYSLNVDGGTWPCLIRVTDDEGTLHTVAAAPALATATTATANITPLTQQVVANLAAADPAPYYATFGASAAATVTPVAVAAAQTAVVAALKASGVDLTGVELISGPVTPAYTAALTALPGTPLLPGDLLLKAAARNCAALRSGNYRVVFPAVNTALADQYGKITINAATLGLIFTDGSTGTWAENGPCRYSDDGGKTDIVVSPAGVIVARTTENNGATHHIAIGIPEQSHTLAELAGSWSAIGINGGNNGLYTGAAFSHTTDAAGVLTAITFCGDSPNWDVKTTCVAVPNGTVTFRANSDGGFDSIENGRVGGRAFAYRAGGGELMIVSIDSDGSLSVSTKQRSNGLPAVGTISTSWNLAQGEQLTSPSAVTATSNTVVSTDAAAASYVRSQRTVGGTNDSPHPETLFANNPRNGYTFRAADGSTVPFSEFTALGMRGMGISALLLPSPKWFMFSVNQPPQP